nr:CPBP family intramembrane glutamic endopeptidase [uncultured Butyricicoccus sp.]
MQRTAQKACKKSFSRLGWVLIVSQLLMLGVVWAGEQIYALFLVIRYPMATNADISRMLYDSGGALIAGALAGIVPCFALGLTTRVQELPGYFLRQRKCLNWVVVLGSLLLVLGLQNIASLFTIPMELIANQLNASFYSAYESATAVSVTPTMLAYSVLIAPFCEELLYRGFVLQYLKPYGKTFAIVFAAVLFGLMHGNIIQLPMALLCGMLFGYIALEYSLPASILIHALTNFTAEAVSWLSSADEVAAEAVNQALFAFGLVALFLCISKLWRPIVTYARKGYAEKGVIRLLMTSPPIILLITYLVVLTGLSIKPI